MTISVAKHLAVLLTLCKILVAYPQSPHEGVHSRNVIPTSTQLGFFSPCSSKRFAVPTKERIKILTRVICRASLNDTCRPLETVCNKAVFAITTKPCSFEGTT